jgi:AraC family transcriptional regulator
MKPSIEVFKETKLVGKNLKMSFSNDKTFELWKSFSPNRKKIQNQVNTNLFSVDIYPRNNFFEQFNVNEEFEKWAAIEVNSFDQIPDKMETLIIPDGLYAVFHYKGKPSDAQATFQYIYGVWLPNSDYEMDNRPYFALMGEKYSGENPDSEEDFWIPIRAKGISK